MYVVLAHFGYTISGAAQRALFLGERQYGGRNLCLGKRKSQRRKKRKSLAEGLKRTEET